MTLKYSMVIQWSDEDQAYVVTLPEFPYCMTHGASYAEAARMGEDVLQTMVDTHAPELGELPVPRTYDGQSRPQTLTNDSAEVAESATPYLADQRRP